MLCTPTDRSSTSSSPTSHRTPVHGNPSVCPSRGRPTAKLCSVASQMTSSACGTLSHKSYSLVLCLSLCRYTFSHTCCCLYTVPTLHIQNALCECGDRASPAAFKTYTESETRQRDCPGCRKFACCCAHGSLVMAWYASILVR